MLSLNGHGGSTAENVAWPRHESNLTGSRGPVLRPAAGEKGLVRFRFCLEVAATFEATAVGADSRRPRGSPANGPGVFRPMRALAPRRAQLPTPSVDPIALCGPFPLAEARWYDLGPRVESSPRATQRVGRF